MSRSPLFDLFDPYGELEAQSRAGLLGDDLDIAGVIDAPRRPKLSDLMPEEEKSSLLGTLARGASSGLATAGYLLDTPGAFVRGVLAGKPLSVFGSSEDRVSGRDLLREWGMAEDEDTWGNFAGSFLLETALDPFTYGTLGLSALGKGALSQAGKATKAVGLLRDDALDSVARLNKLRADDGLRAYDDDFMPRVREYRRRATPRKLLDDIQDPIERADVEKRLRQQFERYGVGDEGFDAPVGVFDNFRVPGTNYGFEIDGGAFGDSVAQFFDAAGNWSKTAPVVGNVTRTAAAVFDPSVGGLGTLQRDLDVTNELQLNKRMATREARDRQEDIRKAYALLQYDARNAAVPDVIPSGPMAGTPIPEELRSFDQQRLWNALNDYVEAPTVQGPTLTGAPISKSTGDAVADWVLENIPEFKNIRDRFESLGPDARAAAAAVGLPAPQMASTGVEGFLPRQLRFFADQDLPEIPGKAPRGERRWGRDERAFSVADNFGRSRDPAYDLPGGNRAFRVLTGNADQAVFDSRALQDALLQAPTSADRRKLLEKAFDDMAKADPIAFTRRGTGRPYDYVVDSVRNSSAFKQADPATQQKMLDEAQETIGGYYDQLSSLLMGADRQFADEGIGIFDTPSWNNALRYEMGQAKNAANVEQLTKMLERHAVRQPAGSVRGGAYVPLTDAASRLGYDEDNFRKVWQQLTGGGDVSNYSIPENMVEAMRTLAPETRLAPPERGLLGSLDQFTNAFKIGALASPAFHVRNAYSGAYNAATQGAFNPLDYAAAFLASQGMPDMLKSRLAKAPAYQGMTPDEALRAFIGDSGAQRVSSGNVISDLSGQSDPATVRGLYPGASNEPTIADAAAELVTGRKGRGWGEFLNDFFSLRGVGLLREARPVNTNPLLVLNDAVGQGVEDMLRTGTFLNQVRKGVDPAVAGDLTRLTQLDYAPEAFTSFERSVMKRGVPFYSFQKQILPSIAENILYQPGGLQGQTIRAIARGSEPSEDNFVPDHLRQSAAIPLPDEWPSIFGGRPAEGLQRYVTNIDLPFEQWLNTFSPGIGATTSAKIADTVKRTGSNLLGNLNPLPKSILEYITNRQLYTGRELSDTYSVLERDLGPIGRPLEQALVNLVPFGARANSLYRQLTDERLDSSDAALKALLNVTAGFNVTDVDEKRAERQAARNMLNSILETTPGVRTYENITVPEDALRAMPEDQRRLYLLYRVLQSDAAQKAREKKKAALDPLEVLGAVR